MQQSRPQWRLWCGVTQLSTEYVHWWEEEDPIVNSHTLLQWANIHQSLVLPRSALAVPAVVYSTTNCVHTYIARGVLGSVYLPLLSRGKGRRVSQLVSHSPASLLTGELSAVYPLAATFSLFPHVPVLSLYVALKSLNPLTLSRVYW